MTNNDRRKFKTDCFAAWYESLTWTDVTPVRQQLIGRLGISRQTLANYYTGKTEIPEMAIPTINSIAQRDIFTK